MALLKSSFLKETSMRIGMVYSKDYQAALNILTAVILDGLLKFNKAIIRKSAGPVCAGAKGVSIYYPRSGAIDLSYLQTLFAKNSAWPRFIQLYHT
jgi:hypothetical protein